MSYPVLKGASYVLINTPDMIANNGSTCSIERISNPNSQFLKEINNHIRSYEEVVNYIPNQVYIGNNRPEELRDISLPWSNHKIQGNRVGKFGEIMPQDEFIALMKICDAFELVKLNEEFIKNVKHKIEINYPELYSFFSKLKADEIDDADELIQNHKAEGLYNKGKLVGYIKTAHYVDINLNAHTMFENLVAKASGVLSAIWLIRNSEIRVEEVDYVIECSEEACGDMNQRGGGNFAKSIAEMVGFNNATGSDTRGFCAAPIHALIEASALVKSGVYKNVVVVAGGATAKLGMNAKDHIKKGLPVLEDVLGGFAVLVSENDDKTPVIRTDLIGKHNVGTGSSPQAVMTALISSGIEKDNLKITDVDVFSVEMQNPDITKPAGAGDVPEANYKMIGALAVKRGELEKKELKNFISQKGLPGWAPTQGHIPSGVPYIGFCIDDLTTGDKNRAMIVGKGSLFLGRMTNLFDGVSFIVERNGLVNEKDIKEINNESQKPKKIRIGLTTLGSEHGIENLVNGAHLAKSELYDIVLIGPKVDTELEVVDAQTEAQMHEKMESLLQSGYIDSCVTMHYNFPIGVSTVGRVNTPKRGKEIILATTTGTSATNKVEAMLRNAISGIATAKSIGIKKPKVGIMNVEGARQVEKYLKELKENGYQIEFCDSVRSDKGCIMRGNDLLAGEVDVMVTDTLSGNIFMKVLSSFTTGGTYESIGYGYGPGVGENYDKNILILSRASGEMVVVNAIKYAYEVVKGDICNIAKKEFENAKKSKLQDIIKEITNKDTKLPKEDTKIEILQKEVVTHQISGIDVMELEEAVYILFENKIYAESGMGCTGAIILVNENKSDEAIDVLTKAGYTVK